MKFRQVKEGEFRRLAETKTMTKLLAQESELYPAKFHLVGIDQHNNLAYAIRHGRTPNLRTWRLDNLVLQIKEMGFSSIEIQLTQEN